MIYWKPIVKYIISTKKKPASFIYLSALVPRQSLPSG